MASLEFYFVTLQMVLANVLYFFTANTSTQFSPNPTAKFALEHELQFFPLY